MKPLFQFLLLAALGVALINAEGCADEEPDNNLEPCTETEYNSYVECIRKRSKRGIGCQNSQVDDCSECDCEYESGYESQCNSCCPQNQCTSHHCCHRTCHQQCSTQTCRRSCRKSCVKHVTDREPSTSTVDKTVIMQGDSSAASHNITTIIQLHNTINNTNLIDVPIVVNNTNFNNITLEGGNYEVSFNWLCRHCIYYYSS